MAVLRLFLQALFDRIDVGGIGAVSFFLTKAGSLALCLTLAMTAGCSDRECPDSAANVIRASPDSVRPVSSDPELQDFLARHKEATIRMLNGDGSSWRELASHADDATLFPPFGGVERGWAQVGARYEVAAGRRRTSRSGEATLDIEVIASGVSGELAYLVFLERSLIHEEGAEALRPGFTRVTHILRREQGRWVLLHRHMDHLPEQYTRLPQ